MTKILLMITNSRGDLFVETIMVRSSDNIRESIDNYMKERYKDGVTYVWEKLIEDQKILIKL